MEVRCGTLAGTCSCRKALRPAALLCPQVTRENFEQVLPRVRAALQQCQVRTGSCHRLPAAGWVPSQGHMMQWYAFDCEFSGLSTGGKPLDYYASLQDRYMKVSLSAREQRKVIVHTLLELEQESGNRQAPCKPAVSQCEWGWLQWRESAQSFAILQWGLAVALPAQQGLEIQAFNFWVAPCSASRSADSSRFLCQVRLLMVQPRQMALVEGTGSAGVHACHAAAYPAQ